MIAKSIYKIPEGKLVKIELDFSGTKINSVKINGDFFLHPEQGIELIEKSLSGKGIEKKNLIDAVNSSVKKNSLELFGISAEGIADAIILAKDAVK